jgi:zinc protease
MILILWMAVPAYAVPEIQHWTTQQGGRVYFVPTQGLPLIDFRVVFDAGSARDGQQLGLAALTSTLLDSGAGEWSADAIAKRLDDVGAQLGTGLSQDLAWLSLRSLSLPDKLQVALDTAQEILAHPRFDPTDFEREKQRTLLAIKQRGESPDELASIAFFKLIYGHHPYAHPEEGFAHTVEALTRNDLVAFHKKMYTARNAIVVIVGDLPRPAAETTAEKLLAGLPQGEVPPALPTPAAQDSSKTEAIPFPSEQTHVLAGTLGMKVNDLDYFPLYVGNHILGGSGLVSQISKEVREKRGLSYSAHSYFFPFRELGIFQIGLQTRHDQADEALRIALKTLADFVAKGPTEEEVDAAKKNIMGGFVLRLDSNQKLIEQITAIAFYNRPLDYLATYTDRIKAVTREDIKRAFRSRIDPAKLQIVLAGGGAKPKTKP